MSWLDGCTPHGPSPTPPYLRQLQLDHISSHHRGGNGMRKVETSHFPCVLIAPQLPLIWEASFLLSRGWDINNYKTVHYCVLIYLHLGACSQGPSWILLNYSDYYYNYYCYYYSILKRINCQWTFTVPIVWREMLLRRWPSSPIFWFSFQRNLWFVPLRFLSFL